MMHTNHPAYLRQALENHRIKLAMAEAARDEAIEGQRAAQELLAGHDESYREIYERWEEAKKEGDTWQSRYRQLFDHLAKTFALAMMPEERWADVDAVIGGLTKKLAEEERTQVNAGMRTVLLDAFLSAAQSQRDTAIARCERLVKALREIAKLDRSGDPVDEHDECVCVACGEFYEPTEGADRSVGQHCHECAHELLGEASGCARHALAALSEPAAGAEAPEVKGVITMSDPVCCRDCNNTRLFSESFSDWKSACRALALSFELMPEDPEAATKLLSTAAQMLSNDSKTISHATCDLQREIKEMIQFQKCSIEYQMAFRNSKEYSEGKCPT